MALEALALPLAQLLICSRDQQERGQAALALGREHAAPASALGIDRGVLGRQQAKEPEQPVLRLAHRCPGASRCRMPSGGLRCGAREPQLQAIRLCGANQSCPQIGQLGSAFRGSAFRGSASVSVCCPNPGPGLRWSHRVRRTARPRRTARTPRAPEPAPTTWGRATKAGERLRPACSAPQGPM